MLANEDYLAALIWAESVGGLEGLIKRSNANLAVWEEFAAEHDWIDFLAENKEIRSNTSVCFKVNLPEDKLKEIVKLLADEGVAYDCGSYRDAPPGLRFWSGATVETSDIEIVTQWLEWAYNEVA
jgi:phosphoserine aminotransferase